MTIEWTCHVCGKVRPDDKISVFTRTNVVPGTDITFQENVRYCNDNPECAAGAPEITWTSRERMDPLKEPSPKEVYEYETMYRGFSILRLIRYWIGELRWRKKFWERNKCHDA